MKNIKNKWHYYGYKETGFLWKQKEPIKSNPSSKFHLWVLTKSEALDLEKQKNIKIKTIINLKTSKMAKEGKKSKKDKEGKKTKNKEKDSKKNKEVKKEKPSGNSDAVVLRKLSGSIALSKLEHVMMDKKNKKGKKIRCIVIPIKSNYLFESKDGGVYMNVIVNLKDKEDQYNQHGFIGQSVPSDMYKEASEEEKQQMKKTPILGGLKDWEFSATSNDTAGKAGDDIDEDDDLPF
jgi:hypothetical protein